MTDEREEFDQQASEAFQRQREQNTGPAYYSRLEARAAELEAENARLRERLKILHQAGDLANEAKEVRIAELVKILNEALNHQVANRGTKDAFYLSYSYDCKMPRWVQKAEQAARAAKEEKSNSELEAEIVRLPCTADGVLITIGMAVWKPNYTKGAAIIHCRVESLVLNKRGWCVGTALPRPDNLNARGLHYIPKELYSSEQAARAAKEEKSNVE